MSQQRRTILRVVTRLNIGGPARQVVLLSHALNRDGWETVLVSGQPAPAEGDLGHLVDSSVRWIQLPGLKRAIRPLQDLVVCWQLLRVLRRERPDIVHTHMAKAGALGRLAGLGYNLLQRLRGDGHRARLIHTFHGHVLSGYFGRFSTRMFLWLERWLGRRTDALIAVSRSVREDLIRLGIGDPSRMRVVPLGLDLSALLDSEGTPQTLRGEWGVPPEALLVGMVGRLVPIKQPEVFLRAAQQLVREDPSLWFVLAGDGERRVHLEALARSLGVEGRVVFAGWRQDLPAVYAGLDCVCLTSRNEGTPVSLIEAMASARPVVATAVGGVPDLLGEVLERRDGYDVAQRGLLVRSPQAEAFAEAVKRVLADAPLRERLVAEGRTFVRTQLSAERLIRDIEALYARLLGAGRGDQPVVTTEQILETAGVR
jgi:glycosyltransferase involved in cell wall biosynthesis